MKKKISLLGTSLIGGVVIGSTFYYYKKNKKENEKKNEIFKLSFPHKKFHENVLRDLGFPTKKEIVAFHDGYITSVDNEKRIPNWVIEQFDKKTFEIPYEKKKNRNNFFFTSAPIDYVPSAFKVKNSDYFGSGWTRGHMAAAANHSMSSQQMKETFFLNSNIVPQHYQNNSNFWSRFEYFIRKSLVNDFEKVTVMTGPLFLPKIAERSQAEIRNKFIEKKNPKKMINYEVIGNNQVAVPTHLFKVIVGEPLKKNNKVGISAYVVPNDFISKEKKLEDFEVPVDFIEKNSGFTIFDKIDKNLCVKNSEKNEKIESFSQKFKKNFLNILKKKEKKKIGSSIM